MRDRGFRTADLAGQRALTAEIRWEAFVSVPHVPVGRFFVPTA